MASLRSAFTLHEIKLKHKAHIIMQKAQLTAIYGNSDYNNYKYIAYCNIMLKYRCKYLHNMLTKLYS